MQTHSHTNMLRYYYSKLTSIQKKVFDIIISCIQNYNNIIRLNSCNISPGEIFKLIEIIEEEIKSTVDNLKYSSIKKQEKFNCSELEENIDRIYMAYPKKNLMYSTEMLKQ